MAPTDELPTGPETPNPVPARQTPNSPPSKEAERPTADLPESSMSRAATNAAATTEPAATTEGLENAGRVATTGQEALPPDTGKELSTAIAEAEQIILYTVRHDIEVPKDLLKAVAAARKKGPPDRLSEDDQIKLWQSAQALAKLVQPVTIYSIKATGSTAATIAWSSFSMLLLASLVVTQISWVLGTNTTTSIDNTLKTLQEAKLEWNANLSRHDAIRATPPPEPSDRNVPRTNPADERAKIEEALAKSRDILDQKSRELTAAFQILEQWVYSSPTAFGQRPLLTSVTVSANPGKAEEEDQLVRQQLLLTSAKATLKAMSGYVLPLLYGLLGAAAYVMRTLSKEIFEVTFSNVSNIRFILRLVLGMLSGISVGLILTPDTLPTTLSSITPLALAFLAGYSVELLFSAMDRLISAFSSEGTRSPAK